MPHLRSSYVVERVAAWWLRRCGARDVLAIALPLIVSTSLWTVMFFTDRMFLLWYSDAAMAAAMPSGLLHFTVICLPLHVVAYVSTFVAQYYGAGRREQMGRITWQAIWLGLAAAPVVLATIPLASYAFRLAGHEPGLARLGTIYYQVLALGAGGNLLAAAMSGFFVGRGQTRVVMLVDGSAALLNVLLDYAWVFGRWGFPEGGIAGAAWATAVSQWVAAGMYLLILCRPAERRAYPFFAAWRLDVVLLRRLLRYGWPNGLMVFLEVLGFSLFILLIGRLGQSAAVATTLAFNINNLAFVPMLGLGLGLSTIVGQQLGRNRPLLARRAAWTSLWITLAYMGAMACAYVVVPDWFMVGHRLGIEDPARFQATRDLTVVLLRFVAAYCLFDALNVVFVSVLRGAGDVYFILWTSLAMAPLPVVLGACGMRWFGWGLLAMWWLITVWICLLGLIYFARYLCGRWETMRVIEPQLTSNDAKSLSENPS